MKSITTLPVFAQEAGLGRYLYEIYRIPVLSREEEQGYISRWCGCGDVKAAHKLILSHLRLVVKIACRFKGYGAPLLDLISEGNLGLMRAVQKFRPEFGCRIATYALLWIKATIQDYVLKSWSILKVSTSVIKKKLFYNLGKIKQKIANLCGNATAVVEGTLKQSRNLDKNEVENVGALSIMHSEVPSACSYDDDMVSMSRNITSLNNCVSNAGDSKMELIDFVEDDNSNHETMLIAQEDNRRNKIMLYNAINKLSTREKDILQKRRLAAKPVTLDTLATHYNISRERIRQIEERTIQKLKQLVCEQSHLGMHKLENSADV
ncbi:RNA polymerase sigma factor RpoH [Alphaproteobacteria bacterium]